jgi:hypothetical protein
MTGRVHLSRREALIAGLGGAALAAHPSWAFQARTDPLDAIIGRFMTEFEIPGAAVALIRFQSVARPAKAVLKVEPGGFPPIPDILEVSARQLVRISLRHLHAG